MSTSCSKDVWNCPHAIFLENKETAPFLARLGLSSSFLLPLRLLPIMCSHRYGVVLPPPSAQTQVYSPRALHQGCTDVNLETKTLERVLWAQQELRQGMERVCVQHLSSAECLFDRLSFRHSPPATWCQPWAELPQHASLELPGHTAISWGPPQCLGTSTAAAFEAGGSTVHMPGSGQDEARLPALVALRPGSLGPPWEAEYVTNSTPCQASPLQHHETQMSHHWIFHLLGQRVCSQRLQILM